MEFQELYKEAKEFNCFYFMASLPVGTKESQELEIILQKLGFGVALTIIGNSRVTLGVRLVTNMKGEDSTNYNQTIAQSLAKCLNTKVIMGEGEAAPAVYSCACRPQTLESNDISALLTYLVGEKAPLDIATLSSHGPKHGFNAAIMRELFYARAHDFGDDVIATEIAASAELNHESSPWLDSIRKSITNQKALDYLNNEIANHPAKSIKFGGETFFDLIERGEI